MMKSYNPFLRLYNQAIQKLYENIKTKAQWTSFPRVFFCSLKIFTAYLQHYEKMLKPKDKTSENEKRIKIELRFNMSPTLMSLWMKII